MAAYPAPERAPRLTPSLQRHVRRPLTSAVSVVAARPYRKRGVGTPIRNMIRVFRRRHRHRRAGPRYAAEAGHVADEGCYVKSRPWREGGARPRIAIADSAARLAALEPCRAVLDYAWPRTVMRPGAVGL
jgi:hypothetical protein